MRMKVYISGPITNIPYDEAKEAFNKAEQLLQNVGFEPVNPFKEVPKDKNKSWSDYMREDIKLLMDCDCIYMLDGWQGSKSAIIERDLAKNLGMLEVKAIQNMSKADEIK